MADVRHNPEKSRYEIFVDDERVGLMTYRVDGDLVTTPHTEIDDAYGGRGLGQQLVKSALDEIRDAGRYVQPLCPFVKAYIDKHPDYRTLVKGS